MSHVKHRISISLITSFVILSVTQVAYAVTLVGGTTVSVSGTTLFSDPSLAGTVVAGDILTPFNDGLGTTGHIQTDVTKETVSGTLDFYFRVFNDPTSTENILLFRTSNYSALPSVDVNFRLDGLGTNAPNAVGGSAGLVGVVFEFITHPITPGSSSLFLFIRTSLTDSQAQFGVNNADLVITPSGSDIEHLSGLVSVFQPAAAVPEPSTWLLLGSGLAGLAAWRRKKAA